MHTGRDYIENCLYGVLSNGAYGGIALIYPSFSKLYPALRLRYAL